MTAQGRKAISRGIKKYWAAKRAAKAEAKPAPSAEVIELRMGDVSLRASGPRGKARKLVQQFLK